MGIDARIIFSVPYKPSKEQISLWGLSICAALGAKNFMINRKSPRRAIEFTEDYNEQGRDGKVYFQDGDEKVARPSEWFLNVSVWTRFYGVGYERGDVLFICAIASWLEQNIPSCTVFYGGDSSGVLAEPFNKAARETLLTHFYSQNGRNYFRDRSSFPNETWATPDTKDHCKLCTEGEYIHRYGFGGGYSAVSCAACGVQLETRDGGKTWTEPSKDSL